MKKRKRVRWRGGLPGTASHHIRHAALSPGDKVILICRVSTCQQDRNGNLLDQRVNLQRIAEQAGATVVDVLAVAASGFNPDWLFPATVQAMRTGAILLAESTDRFIRNSEFHSAKRPNLQATERELRHLEILTEGVPLMTVLDPDSTPATVRSFQRKRGQSAKNSRGGRPKVTDQQQLRRAIWEVYHRTPS